MLNTSRSLGAVALLITPRGDVLMQRKTLDYPSIHAGMLTLFGGGVDEGETAVEAIVRELNEELELHIGSHHNLTSIGIFDEQIEATNKTNKAHVFVATNISQDALVLHEGERIECRTAEEHLVRSDLTPLARIALQAFVTH